MRRRYGKYLAATADPFQRFAAGLPARDAQWASKGRQMELEL